MKNIFLLASFTFLSFSLLGQHKIGVRAGLNYSKFSGPLEQNETYGVSGGFHFGINYTYQLNDKLGIRGELLYTQRGSGQSFIDTAEGSYYIIKTLSSLESFVEFGSVELNLDVSNASLSIPITVQYQLSRKFEIFGGLSIDFLVGPSARGKTKFRSFDRPDEIFFEQNHDFRYAGDEAGEYNTLDRRGLSIIIDGNSVPMAKTIGAYYHFTTAQKMGNRFNGIDSHLNVGLNYFLNTGFYVGARIEYGLTDITNNNMDYSLRELDDDLSYIFRDDKDRSLSLNLSFGFRF